MSFSMDIDVEGFPALQRKLRALEDYQVPYVDEALDFQCEKIKNIAVSICPKRTGWLANSIVVSRFGQWAFQVMALTPYAMFVEYGTKFMAPRRFMARALELGMLGLIQHVNRAINKAIRDAARS